MTALGRSSSLPSRPWIRFVLCKTALSAPWMTPASWGRIPNLPDRLPHLRHLRLNVCELERRSDDGSESPHVALRRLLRHRHSARIENPMASVKCYCGPMSPSKDMNADLRSLVPRFECVVVSLITQAVECGRQYVRHDTSRPARPRSSGNLVLPLDTPTFAT